MKTTSTKTYNLGELKRKFANGKVNVAGGYYVNIINTILNCEVLPTVVAESDKKGVLTILTKEPMVAAIVRADFSIFPIHTCNKLLKMEITIVVINPSTESRERDSVLELFS